jgi:hypothetical protein
MNRRHAAVPLWVLLSVPLLGAGTCGGGSDGGTTCASDRDCSDRIYCNGVEACLPTNPSADARGCVKLAVAACPSGSVCSNADQGCMPVCTTTITTGCLPPCRQDLDCSNSVFCDGQELCMPGGAGADARGCLPSRGPPCFTNQSCDEADQRCVSTCTDADGDGHYAMACGGDDCDDHDVNDFPGNPEVCDPSNHDEDCDPTTFGHRDTDGDGYDDAACCNGTHCGSDCNDANPSVHPNQVEVCNGIDDNCRGGIDEGVSVPLYVDGDLDGFGAGAPDAGCPGTAGRSTLGNDCDDTNPAIVPGAMICTGTSGGSGYSICQSNGTYASSKCSLTATCHAQPNGTGICL